ncbi:MAG: isoprenylcysteine carboxylmethyltransferase family protein [Deltaproteobacteria bacterium]|nr:isoprenylcysteine carboxylmethyltransferase family protein [Deltaproteobacteria bacterium]
MGARVAPSTGKAGWSLPLTAALRLVIVMLLKIAIPLYSLLLFSAVAIKKTLVQKKIGRSPLIILRSPLTAENYLQRLAFLFFPLWLGGMNLFAFRPGLYDKIQHLDGPPHVRSAGLVLLFASWILFVTALVTMRNAWRFGIDREGSAELVERGIYRRIRHPIYASMKAALVATLVIFPNFYFFWIGTAAFFGFSMIALMEEDFLKKRLGQKYEDYARRTGRFLPKFF